MLRHALFQLERLHPLLFHKGKGAGYDGQNLVRRKGLELKDGRARQNGGINIKVGVFGGGGDERDVSLFGAFQQRLLLFFIEILNFVDIEKHPVGRHQRPGLGDGLADVVRAGGGGVDAHQRLAGVTGKNIGHGGFSDAGRPVKDHVGQNAAFENPHQKAVFPQQMTLPRHLGELGGAHSIGQWLQENSPR